MATAAVAPLIKNAKLTLITSHLDSHRGDVVAVDDNGDDVGEGGDDDVVDDVEDNDNELSECFTLRRRSELGLRLQTTDCRRSFDTIGVFGIPAASGRRRRSVVCRAVFVISSFSRIASTSDSGWPACVSLGGSCRRECGWR